MNLKNILKSWKIDIFNPFIVIIFIFLFLIIAVPSLYFSSELHPPSNHVYLFIAIGVFFFILGLLIPEVLKLSKMFKSKVKKFGKIQRKRSISNKTGKKLELSLELLVIAGIILQIINIVNLGGIPLFSGYLKADAATKLWLFSYIFFLTGINLLFARFKKKSHYLLLILGLILFILTGYRTTPIVILLSVFITLYYTRKFKMKHSIILIAIIGVLLIVIGFIATKSIEWQHWRLNPIELLSYRAGFTVNILDRATYLQGSTNGTLFYYTLTGFFKSVDPRVLVGEAVIGKSHSITSTIFGPAILDFGMAFMGVQMFVIGLILKLLYVLQKNLKGIAIGVYGILLAQTIVWIETGPTDLVVWFFYLIAILFIIYYFIAKDENKTV